MFPRVRWAYTVSSLGETAISFSGSQLARVTSDPRFQFQDLGTSADFKANFDETWLSQCEVTNLRRIQDMLSKYYSMLVL